MKTKMILSVTGGVAGAAVLATAYLAWHAYAGKVAALEGDADEGADGLVAVFAQAQSLARKPLYPSAQNVTAVKSNETLVLDWRSEALKQLSRGDRAFEKTTPPAFKAFIVADAKRLQMLPGAVEGHLAKAGFAFGPFKDYIVDGKLPAEADLATLQRKWDDVALVAEVLSRSGVAELTDVQFKATAAEIAQAEAEKKAASSKKKAKPRKGKDPAQDAASRTAAYVFTFSALPAAFVRVVNALATGERFTAVTDFSFSRSPDVVNEMLGGEERKAEASAPAGGRGRRRRATAAVEKKADEEEPAGSRVVSDPATDAPMTVTLSVVVHDFKTLEGETSEEGK